MYSRKGAQRRAEQTVPEAVHDTTAQPRSELVALQQHAGNAAVARLIQRAPRDRPASTDAPGAHHGSGSGKAGPAKAQADIHARVIKIDIDQDKAVITIASGPDQGVQVGMTGSLVTAHGTEYADFTIETAAGRASTAHVQATFDQVKAEPNAVIKGSSAPESQEGKEF